MRPLARRATMMQWRAARQNAAPYAGRNIMATTQPNILILWGDDIGWWNISYNSRGQMGYRTPNIDRVAQRGRGVHRLLRPAELHCRSRRVHHRPEPAFAPASPRWACPAPTSACRRKTRRSPSCSSRSATVTGQFGKNHLGDKDEFLPTLHGFDEFFGNLYHLNAEEEPEHPDYPKDPAFKARFGPRGVLHCHADGKGGQTIDDTGPLTKKRMETIDEEVTEHALRFIDEAHAAERAVLPVVEHHRHALPHPPCREAQGQEQRPGRLQRRDGGARRERRASCSTSSTSWASPTTPS